MYVVDSQDANRMGIAKEELAAMLEEEELKNTSLLVIANKQDMEGALTVTQVSDILGLSLLKNRQWTIFKCSALTGEGLTEAMDWLVDIISPGKK